MKHLASELAQFSVPTFIPPMGRVAMGFTLLVVLTGCEHLEKPQLDYGSLQALVCREDPGADCSITPCCDGLGCSVNRMTGEGRCRLQCDDDTDCPGSQVCASIYQDRFFVCLECVESGDPCRGGCCDGLTCITIEDGGSACAPICKNDADCKEGERCYNVRGSEVDACHAYP